MCGIYAQFRMYQLAERWTDGRWTPSNGNLNKKKTEKNANRLINKNDNEIDFKKWSHVINIRPTKQETPSHRMSLRR